MLGLAKLEQNTADIFVAYPCSFLLPLQSPSGVTSLPGEDQAASQRGLCLPAVDTSHPALQQSSAEGSQQRHAVRKQGRCLHEAQVVRKERISGSLASLLSATLPCWPRRSTQFADVGGYWIKL